MFLTNDTLYLFCDASITIEPGTDKYIGCPGVIPVGFDKNGKMINHLPRAKVLYDSTNNNSEINAILLGTYEAIGLRNNYNRLILLSDSMICIKGLKEWINSWTCNIKNGIMYNSSNEPVANQHVIIRIIQTILDYNLHIELYHQKGHVTNTRKSLDNAKRVFYNSNTIELTDSEIQFISRYNNEIDIFTKDVLLDYRKYGKETYITPYGFDINNCDINRYKQLIGKDDQ